MAMNDLPCGIERSARMYRRLLRAYPASFRMKFGDDMVCDFCDLASETHKRRGRLGLLVLWFRVAADLVRSVPKEHAASWKKTEGGDAMKFHSLFFRKFSSDALDQRLSQIVMFGFAIGLPCMMVRKFILMDLMEPQFFFGVLLLAALSLQLVGLGLLLSWIVPKKESAFSINPGQLAIYSISIALMAAAVLTLSRMAVSEYELIFGLLLIFNAMMGGIFLGTILPIVQEFRRRNHEQIVDNLSTPAAPCGE
jgi:hypothetical protein